jgi:hypothetical protein
MLEGDDHCEQELDDTEFYEEALRALRARRSEEQRHRKNTTNKWLDDDCTESTSSLSLSLLSSWGNTSNEDSWSCSMPLSAHSEEDARVYWNDLRRGKVPLPVLKKPHRHSDGGVGSLPDFLAMLTPRSSISTGNSFPQGNDCGEHTERLRAYRFTTRDLHRLCFDVEGRDFTRLQTTLRNQGAVTNSLLKEVLPLVVQQSQKRQKARQLQQAIELDRSLQLEPERNQSPVFSGKPTATKSPTPFLSMPFSFNKEEKKEENS